MTQLKSDNIFATFSNCGDVTINCPANVDVYQSLEWFKNYEKTVQSTQPGLSRFYCIKGSDENGFDIALPCVVRTKNTLLGTTRHVCAMSNYYTPQYQPIMSGRNLPEGIHGIVQGIIDQEQPCSITLDPLDPSANLTEELTQAFRFQGWLCVVDVAFVNWFHRIEQGFEHYFDARSSRVKNTYIRKYKKFKKLSGSRILIIDGTDNLEQYVNYYQQVYDKSWKIKEKYPEFVPNLIRILAVRGELRMGFAFHDNRPIAAHLWIVSNGVASIFKLSYDKQYAEYSPGTLVMYEMMRHVIEVDHVVEVDFLSGDDSYKSDWMSQRRDRIRLTGFNTRTSSGIYGALKAKLRNRLSR